MEKRSREKYLEQFEQMQDRLIKLAENSATLAETLDNLNKQAIAETYRDKQSALDTIESISHKRVFRSIEIASNEKSTYEQLLSRAMQVDYIVSEIEKQEQNNEP